MIHQKCLIQREIVKTLRWEMAVFGGSTADSSRFHIVQYFIKLLPSFPKSLVGVSLFCLFDMKDSPLVRFTVALDAVELLEE